MAKVLVVDDSKLTRRMLLSALLKAGHECVEAGNGVEGLEAFKQSAPEVVFSDLLMPQMDGFEMTARIRDLSPSTPIIVATADIQDSSRERCEQIGVTKLLNKPLKPEEIAGAVSEVLDGALACQPVEA